MGEFIIEALTSQTLIVKFFQRGRIFCFNTYHINNDDDKYGL